MAYSAFTSELGVHMSEAMLGNEAFIDRVVRSDASLAERVIGKIKSLKEYPETILRTPKKTEVIKTPALI